MDKVFINNLEVEGIIGIFQWEREVRQLISIDIEDCSSSVKSDRWEFVQQDSSDIDSFLLKKPIIYSNQTLLLLRQCYPTYLTPLTLR